jgi:hypothetical protein
VRVGTKKTHLDEFSETVFAQFQEQVEMVQLDRQNAELVNTLNPNNPNASYGRATTASPMVSPNPKASGG